MPVVQNLYQIFKLPASFVVANNCKIEHYTIRKAQKEGNIVSIGDNLVFQQIRYYYEDYRDHREMFQYIQKLRYHSHVYKKQGEYTKSRILEQAITEALFVEDIINVYVDGKKSDFHKFRTKGFECNGKHYTYLCSGSGQIRRNTATFVNSKIRDKLVETLNCGLDKKTSEYVLAKYSAYFALAFSSILWVRTPRVCVIRDFYNTLKNEKVDFICKDKDGKSIIEERVMDIELNGADGQGLIDPEFAKLWGQDMDLPFTPCSFVARSCFIKGNLATFDFKEYAHQHGISTIRDRWGKEYNIDDIDVLVSESQFKTHKYYSSWDEYCSYAQKGNIHWGVARYNKHHDDDYVLANYQYIQALELSQEDIHELIQPTVEWIKAICSGETLPTLLYCFGPKTLDAEYQKMYGTAQTNAMKAVVKNVDFLQDSYIQNKIYKNITETINHAKLGKIWVRGNYQFMVADPVAQCQSALGLPVTGLVKRDEVWSKFWTSKGVKKIDLCRSPMIDVHEHNPCDVHYSDEAEYWYQYLNSGVIFSIYDTSTFRAEDADFDGDIILSTDNPYFIKGSHKDHNIITYEKGLATPAKMTISNITKTVMKGFGTGVGGFSNTATIMYAMAAIFNKPEQKEQHDELMRRIKLLREIVGQEIDRIKGADKPSLPSEWRKRLPVSPDDTEEEKLRKYKHNAMVVSKKPYFFRYLYPELNRRYKQFESAYNIVSQDTFGIKFKKLLKKENKTEEEKNLVRKYQKYSPLITSNCTMNKLCREFESIDFDIKFLKDDKGNKKVAHSMLPTYEAKYAPQYSNEKYTFVSNLYKTYQTRKQVKYMSTIFDNLPDANLEEYLELRSEIISAIIQDLQTQLKQNGMEGEEFLFYCSRLAKNYKSFNWGFAWDILEDQIITLIPYGKSLCPVRDPENGIEYLGNKYSLKDISKQDDITIQNLINAVFGDPNESLTDEEIEKIIAAHLQEEKKKKEDKED